MTSDAVRISERRTGKFGEKYYSGRPQEVLLRNWLGFKSSAWIAVISGFFEPVLYLLSFGYGIGELVGNISTSTGEVSYAAYIAPFIALVASRPGAM